MVTRTISLGDDAYRRLKKLKRPGESFTELILRLTGRGDLTRFSGAISRDLAADLAGSSAALRARWTTERARDR